MARDLENSEWGLNSDEAILRETGAFYSSAYNWLLQLNTAYCYTVPTVIGCNIYAASAGQKVFRSVYQARGPVVEMTGYALDRTTFGGPASGTWVTPGNPRGYISHMFTESQAVTPPGAGSNVWIGTFIADNAHQISLVVVKREDF